MSVLIESIEEAYCERCHLATPLWKLKCIHCGKSLCRNTEKTSIVEKPLSANSSG